jgi:hypothetical protein
LQHLFARDAMPCRQRIARFWPSPVAVQLERAMVAQNLAWFHEQVETLRNELCSSSKIEGCFIRLLDRVQEARRLVGRLVHPTGMIVRIEGEASAQQSDIADRLRCSLGPAFRRSRRVPTPESFWQSLRQDFRTFIARISSTLLIETPESSDRPNTGRSFHLGLARWLARPDLVLQLSFDDENTATAALSGPIVRLKADDSPEQLVEQANIAILNWLAARTCRRLNLQISSSQSLGCPAPIPAPNVEFESVGSD